MQLIDKLLMLGVAVSDMPKAKEFYVEKLGLEVTQDYRQDDDTWYMSLTLPEGGVTINLTFTRHGDIKPGNVGIYFASSDVVAAHKELSDKGVKVSEVQDDLYGPGSGVKFINLQDPDGNQVLLVQE